MKTISIILLISGCVSVSGVAYASIANPVPQENSGKSTANTGSDHSGDAEHTMASSQSKNQKETIASDERAGRHHISSKAGPLRLPTPSKSNRAKQVWQNHEHARSADVTSMHRQVLTKPTSPGTKATGIHTPPWRPATGVAISGQHFRNGRNRSATPAVIGGAAITKRSARGINGTEVGRKHLN